MVLNQFLVNKKNNFKIIEHPNFIGAPNRRISLEKLNRNIRIIEFEISIDEISLSHECLSDLHLEIISENFSVETIYLFVNKNLQVSNSMLGELEIISTLWPDSIYTGGIKLSSGERIEARSVFSFSDSISNSQSYLRNLNRRRAVSPNYNSFAVSGKILKNLKILNSENFGSFIGILIEEIEKQKYPIITSPQLCLESKPLHNTDLFFIANDVLRALPENGNTFFGRIEKNQTNQHKQIEWKQEFDQCEKISALDLLTTLRGKSDPRLLEELASSVLPQLKANVLWRILVHGNLTDEIQVVLDNIKQVNYVEIFMVDEDLTLQIAMRKLIEFSQSPWIFFVDYDDLLFPHTISTIMRSAYPRETTLIIGNELVGEKTNSSRYFKRNLPTYTGIRLFSMFFHPIIVRKSIVLKVLEKYQANYLLDWLIVRDLVEDSGILFIDSPLYFWRTHQKSLTNNTKGSEESHKSVLEVLSEESKILRLMFDLESSIDFSDGEDRITFGINKKFEDVCLHVYGDGNLSEKLRTFEKFRATYPFVDYSMNPVHIGCESEYVLLIPNGTAPSRNFNILQAIGIERMSGLAVIGSCKNNVFGTSSIYSLNQGLARYEVNNDEALLSKSFHGEYHYPQVKMQFASPILVRNQELFLLDEKSVYIYEKNLDILI